MTYRHPQSYRPPLVYGGHEWTAPVIEPEHPAWVTVAQCGRCGSTVPDWSLREGYWLTLAPVVCPAKVRALGSGRWCPTSPGGKSERSGRA